MKAAACDELKGCCPTTTVEKNTAASAAPSTEVRTLHLTSRTFDIRHRKRQDGSEAMWFRYPLSDGLPVGVNSLFAFSDVKQPRLGQCLRGGTLRSNGFCPERQLVRLACLLAQQPSQCREAFLFYLLRFVAQ